MSEKPESFLSPFSKQAAQFTWLIVDVFLLFALLLFFTFYKELSAETLNGQLLRLFLVYSVGHFLLSGLHLLAYHRHDDSQAIKRDQTPNAPYVQFPAWRSYAIFGLKVCWFAAFCWLASARGIIPWFQ
jgi:hypothetical protein